MALMVLVMCKYIGILMLDISAVYIHVPNMLQYGILQGNYTRNIVRKNSAYDGYKISLDSSVR